MVITTLFIIELMCFKDVMPVSFDQNGLVRNCQSWSFITVYGQNNPIDLGYIVRWQVDPVNTKESLLPVCDKPYHKIKDNLPHLEEDANIWNYLLFTSFFLTMIPKQCILLKKVPLET